MQPVLEIVPVLLGEQFRRRHQGHLQPGPGNTGGRRGCDDGLATPDVSLQQPNHGASGAQVRVDLFQHARLRSGECERQGGEKTGFELLRVLQRPRRIRLYGALEQLEAHVMGQ